MKVSINVARCAGVLLAGVVLLAGSTAWALTGTQTGASGATYASVDVQCGVNPVAGMAPMVRAGLLNPKRNANATIALNGSPVAIVTFTSPDAVVWLANGMNTVTVSVSKKVVDSYTFNASVANASQPNMCVPDTSTNTISGDLEYAASMKSYATITPGCALNPLAGRGQPFINLFDNGTYLLNVSVNNVALTQLSASRPHTPVFLGPGVNVIAAANGGLSIDNYVRDGGSGSCTLP